jgi:hypothetical protein
MPLSCSRPMMMSLLMIMRQSSAATPGINGGGCAHVSACRKWATCMWILPGHSASLLTSGRTGECKSSRFVLSLLLYPWLCVAQTDVSTAVSCYQNEVCKSCLIKQTYLSLCLLQHGKHYREYQYIYQNGPGEIFKGYAWSEQPVLFTIWHAA